jgi:hypothetical protein
MSQTKECLGPSVFYMILKFLKKSECYRSTITLCGGPIQVVLTIVTGIKTIQATGILTKFKKKKKKTSFIFKFLLNTEIKEAF